MKENWRYKPTTTRRAPRAERVHFTQACNLSNSKIGGWKKVGVEFKLTNRNAEEKGNDEK